MITEVIFCYINNSKAILYFRNHKTYLTLEMEWHEAEKKSDIKNTFKYNQIIFQF